MDPSIIKIYDQLERENFAFEEGCRAAIKDRHALTWTATAMAFALGGALGFGFGLYVSFL